MGCLKIKYDPVGKTLAKKWKIFERGLEKKGVTIFFYVKTYRYGFNGQEKVDEVKGNGNSYDFGARIHDPRIGRFLSLDPRMSDFPSMSPYVFAANNPIRYVDVYGEGPGDALKKVNAAANTTSNEYWKKSFNADKTVVNEWGFILVEKKTVIKVGNAEEIKTEVYVKNIVKGTGGSTPLNRSVGEGETILGELHTHPYSVSEGSYQGVGFSGADISVLRNNIKNDYVELVEAGTKRFGLVIADEDKAKEFFKNNSREDIQKSWNDAFSKAKGTFQEKVDTAVLSALGADSGIEYHETTDDKKQEFQKVEAKK